jgi:hypothetical protein
MAFLSSSARYIAKVDDPWFFAHTPTTSPGGTTVKDLEVYQFDFYANVIACVTQHQICNPSLSEDQCSPLTTAEKLLKWESDSNSAFNAHQQYTRRRLNELIITSSFSETIDTLRASVLLALNSLSGVVSLPLPPQHWMDEVQNWFEVMLVTLQQGTLAFARGPTDSRFLKYIEQPVAPELLSMCSNQKFRSAEYISFSVFGLSIIIAIGSIVILVNLILDTAVGFIQRMLRKGETKRLEWATNGMLQLQRLAYEGHGIGTWRKLDADVPITLTAEKFGLPIRESETFTTIRPADGNGSDYALIEGENNLRGKSGSFTEISTDGYGPDYPYPPPEIQPYQYSYQPQYQPEYRPEYQPR